MYQAKDLPRLRRTVVDDDDWELVVPQAETRYFSLLETVLEYKNSARLNRSPPQFQRGIVVRFCAHLINRNAEGCSYVFGLHSYRALGGQPDLAPDRVFCRIACLIKLVQSRLKRVSLANQKDRFTL